MRETTDGFTQIDHLHKTCLAFQEAATDIDITTSQSKSDGKTDSGKPKWAGGPT